MVTEKILIGFFVLIAVHAIIYWMHRHTDRKVSAALAPYELHGGYRVENSPLVKRRKNDRKTAGVGVFAVSVYFLVFGLLLFFMGGVNEGVSLPIATIGCALVGAMLATGFVLLSTLLSLMDGRGLLLNEIIEDSRLAVILMSKQLHTPHVYGRLIQDEKLVKNLLEAMPIVDDLCRLNELRDGIKGKADTDTRKQTLVELESLIEEKNAELTPYVDMVFTSVGAKNPLVEAETNFNKVEKEIALAKGKVELT